MAYVGKNTVYFKWQDDEDPYLNFHLCLLFDESVENDILEIKEAKAYQRKILKDQLITLGMSPLYIALYLVKLNPKEAYFHYQILKITIKDLSNYGFKRLFQRPKRPTI